ncbi:MAG TPA: hypothetical protein DEP51_03025 [Clostridiales bacterium]|nr:hypothetical protein [Clostridiales bacterium]
MKNKIFFITVFLMMSILFTNNCIFASMADYTDEDAEKETQRMIQEHKDSFDNTKSNNCFLKELFVKGGTLSPNFDRQVINYDLKIENNVNEIDIIANAEDADAKVNGNGKIDIKDISECKIEVRASSGTTRTYFVRIIKENEKDTVSKNEEKSGDNKDSNEIDIEDSIITDSKNLTENLSESNIDDNKKTGKNKYIIIAIVAIFLLISLVIIIKIKKRKNH